MRMSLEYKDSILALFEAVKVKKEKAGESWSDSSASKLCFGHGEYVGNLRRWTGGKGGPTLEKTAKFEVFLKDQITDEEYENFIVERARKIVASADDFDN